MISVATVLAPYRIDINNMNTRCLKCSINHYCTYYNQKYLIPIDLFVPNSFPYMDPILYIRPPAGIAFPTLSIIGSKIVPVPNVVDAEGRIIYILVSNLKNVPFPISLNPDYAHSIFLFPGQLLRVLLPHLQRSHPAVPSSALSPLSRLINQCSEVLYPRFAAKFDESKRILHSYPYPQRRRPKPNHYWSRSLPRLIA